MGGEWDNEDCDPIKDLNRAREMFAGRIAWQDTVIATEHEYKNAMAVVARTGRKQLVFAYNRAHYEDYVKEQGLNPAIAIYVSGVNSLRGRRVDSVDLMYLDNWKLNPIYQEKHFRVTLALFLST